MPLAHHNCQSIFFAHVPKAGGSSVEDYLASRFGQLSLIDSNKRDGVNGTGLIVPATHLAADDLKELLPPNLSYCFAVVRDPLERLASEFRYQSGLSRMSKLGFSLWLKVMLKAAKIEPRIYENHIRPQSNMIPDRAEIFKLEEGFDRMISALDRVTGTTRTELTVPHINTRKKEHISVSRADVRAVIQFYADDYDRFGYTYPEPSDYPEIPSFWRDALVGPLAAALVAKQRRDWVK